MRYGKDDKLVDERRVLREIFTAAADFSNEAHIVALDALSLRIRPFLRSILYACSNNGKYASCAESRRIRRRARN
jgi:hypothetical protein